MAKNDSKKNSLTDKCEDIFKKDKENEQKKKDKDDKTDNK